MFRCHKEHCAETMSLDMKELSLLDIRWAQLFRDKLCFRSAAEESMESERTAGLIRTAHSGSDLVAMSSSILGMFRPLSPKGVESLVKFAFPVLKDLDIESDTFKNA